jgi:hypothetical protein
MRRSLWLDLGSCLLIQAGCLILLRGVALLHDATRSWPAEPPAVLSASPAPHPLDRRPAC